MAKYNNNKRKKENSQLKNINLQKVGAYNLEESISFTRQKAKIHHSHYSYKKTNEIKVTAKALPNKFKAVAENALVDSPIANPAKYDPSANIACDPDPGCVSVPDPYSDPVPYPDPYCDPDP